MSLSVGLFVSQGNADVAGCGQCSDGSSAHGLTHNSDHCFRADIDATVSDDETFEQIKKQLNRLVEVIKVIDFTDIFVRMKEILYVKVRKCTPEDKRFRLI